MKVRTDFWNWSCYRLWLSAWHTEVIYRMIREFSGTADPVFRDWSCNDRWAWFWYGRFYVGFARLTEAAVWSNVLMPLALEVCPIISTVFSQLFSLPLHFLTHRALPFLRYFWTSRLALTALQPKLDYPGVTGRTGPMRSVTANAFSPAVRIFWLACSNLADPKAVQDLRHRWGTWPSSR
jgi:hypothetical protein